MGNRGFYGFSGNQYQRSYNWLGWSSAVDSEADTFRPNHLGGLNRWYDFATSRAGDTTVVDRAGIANGTLTGAFIWPSARDGKSVCSISTHQARLGFTGINFITAIQCRVEIAGGYFFSDSSNHHFHPDVNVILHPSFSHINARNGLWRTNGLRINPLTQNYAGGWHVTSVVCAGALSQNRIGFDRTFNDSLVVLAEVAVYDRALPLDEVRLVERYMAHKWKIYGYSPD
ncbi:MAG TPA: hypothetical protein VLH56_05240 [Dissulfurispiraceae bacterium]|nr:hypothetical protein [Dissulfurispiraceae bacterium]